MYDLPPQTMNTCKNCLYWTTAEQLTTGECNKVNHETPRHIGLKDTSAPDTFEVQVTVADDHNLGTWLITGPDFGCIKFEQK
jgi:hypothetical protein